VTRIFTLCSLLEKWWKRPLRSLVFRPANPPRVPRDAL